MGRFNGWNDAAVLKLTGGSKAPTVRSKQHNKVNDYTERIAAALNILGISCEREYRFVKDRRFRFDVALPDHKIAIEFEGNIFPKKCDRCSGCGCKSCNFTGKSVGRHNRGKGYANDVKKYNLATMNGWKLLRYTTEDTKSDMWEYKIAGEVKRLIESSPIK